MREYEKHEKESYLIGKLDQCCSKSTNRCKNSVRERQKFKYGFLDMFICEDAFMFIHDIGNKAFKNLKQHYKIKFRTSEPWSEAAQTTKCHKF